MDPRLKALLALPENKRCADCWGQQPRFASVTHGVFLCNRCFGVHRGMGVHISRTRSVQLDQWNDEQISAMARGGNAAHALVWESGMPEGARPPSDVPDAQRETFVRAKYERRCPHPTP
ncbi:hypothetical protein T484DRAFT_1642836 [Baffinella frigidus]|nr:hypothetical protein T484DRAFT_1642836 [Cryptophyta sp. CCMP2293]